MVDEEHVDGGSDVDGVLQAALQRLALLAEATDALSSTLDGTLALRRLCQVLLPQLGDWCAADLLDEHRRPRRVVVAHWERLPTSHLEGQLPPVPETSADPLARVLRGAGPLLVDPSAMTSMVDDSALHTEQVALFSRLGARSAVIAPLRARRQVLGALTLARTGEALALTENDLALVEDLAHRTALAVDNSRLYTSVQSTAEHLQRSLLPVLPDVTPLSVAARYVPARAAVEVGGDWYDCFPLPDGATALIIGDVTGHDLSAAVTMGQLRNMLRALVCDRLEPPGDILRRLDAIAHTLYGGHTATCIYAHLQPVPQPAPQGRWQLDIANAGHPPPLLVAHDGDTCYLDTHNGVLLGIDPHTPRPSRIHTLPPASTLLLYTDGLIERPGEDIDRGLARLREHAAALAREPLSTFCDELLAGLAGGSNDDIALLAVRLPPAR
ncbi:PP2C family protein-serine/threonine phosphatase [Streptomyces cadmiisoli]|uniref:protein-serine/threonine phosphatase n=1 Tax=Streptomyces cadmiisoli TaxID=2184053 RepID=A0A2Z4IU72_9ACTN|nr:GAF domain-containing SpoIIE family protein phosphatase [Streptomyces cadmiisoli]AWW35783.1 DNA-binding protein [Streptomyces cadmiisoli]